MLFRSGCMRVFPPSFVKGVIDLYMALRDGDRDLAVSAYETWGFENISSEMLEALNIWARFIYAPLLEDKPQRLMESASGVYGAKAAQQTQLALRRPGGVPPPPRLVLMDRAAIGLGSVFMHLKAEINWYRLFNELIDGFDVDKLAQRQAQALKAAGLSKPA